MVCLGNICRSPLAHGILASKLPADKFYVDSAGTGNYHIGSKPDHRSIEVASNFGIDISNQKCRQFVAADFDNFHLIYVMDDSNYKIGNIDATICLEVPKIKPHSLKMRQVIAEILSIEENAISVKATTAEKMGFVGREEGIAAYASVLLMAIP